MATFDFKAIGTTWKIDIYTRISETEKKRILSLIQERIEVFDKVYSRFRADSLVTRMSKEAGTFLLPDDAVAMFDLYHDLYVRTGGLVTPLVGNLISDAGYDAEYSLQQKKMLAAAPAWEDVIEFHSPNVIVKKPVMLDFGAAGKGYLVDIIGGVLEENDVMEYCIDAGGDILYKNSEPIRVGLEDPTDTTQVVGVYTLSEGSICGSAGNRRVWGDFTHIINPKTLTSPRDILAVWVVAKTALVADALATCLFFVDARALIPAYDFEYVLIRSDRSIEKSKGFTGELFTE